LEQIEGREEGEMRREIRGDIKIKVSEETASDEERFKITEHGEKR